MNETDAGIKIYSSNMKDFMSIKNNGYYDITMNTIKDDVVKRIQRAVRVISYDPNTFKMTLDASTDLHQNIIDVDARSIVNADKIPGIPTLSGIDQNNAKMMMFSTKLYQAIGSNEIELIDTMGVGQLALVYSGFAIIQDGMHTEFMNLAYFEPRKLMMIAASPLKYAYHDGAKVFIFARREND